MLMLTALVIRRGVKCQAEHKADVSCAECGL
jgi:hypothetical protein